MQSRFYASTAAAAAVLFLFSASGIAQVMPQPVAHPPGAPAQMQKNADAEALAHAADQALQLLAKAEHDPQSDPRMAGAAIQALSAVVVLREAELRALDQDLRAKLAQREKDWAEYSAPLWKPAATN